MRPGVKGGPLRPWMYVRTIDPGAAHLVRK